jgi:hypothetical protein
MGFQQYIAFTILIPCIRASPVFVLG